MGGTVGLRGMSPFGWWWGWLSERPGSPATRSRSRGASGIDGSGRARLQKEWGKEGKWSAMPHGSRSKEDRGGGGLYHANADEPRRRSSSSSGSGDKWVVREVDYECGGATGSEREARGRLI